MVICNYCGKETGDGITCCGACAKKAIERIDNHYRPPTSPPKTPSLPFNHYRCPRCGYIITEEMYQQARYNYTCQGNNGECWKALIDYVFIKARK